MRKHEIVDKLKEIFGDLFSATDIDENTVKNDVLEWDSLGHLRLFMAVEESTGLKFSIDEMSKVGSVKELVELIMKKKGML